jgi:hypothetical protein
MRNKIKKITTEFFLSYLAIIKIPATVASGTG